MKDKINVGQIMSEDRLHNWFPVVKVLLVARQSAEGNTRPGFDKK